MSMQTQAVARPVLIGKLPFPSMPGFSEFINDLLIQSNSGRLPKFDAFFELDNDFVLERIAVGPLKSERPERFDGVFHHRIGDQTVSIFFPDIEQFFKRQFAAQFFGD